MLVGRMSFTGFKWVMGDTTQLKEIKQAAGCFGHGHSHGLCSLYYRQSSAYGWRWGMEMEREMEMNENGTS